MALLSGSGMSLAIPREICEIVINLVNEDAIQALLTCALVCPAWTRPAQRRIFHSIPINIYLIQPEKRSSGVSGDFTPVITEPPPSTGKHPPFFTEAKLHRLADVLSTSPELASFVKEIYWNQHLQGADNLLMQARNQTWLSQNKSLFAAIFDSLPSISYLSISIPQCVLNQQPTIDPHHPDTTAIYQSLMRAIVRSDSSAMTLDIRETGFMNLNSLLAMVTSSSSLKHLKLDGMILGAGAWGVGILTPMDPFDPPSTPNTSMIKLKSLKFSIFSGSDIRDGFEGVMKVLLHPHSGFHFNGLEKLEMDIWHHTVEFVQLFMQRCPSIKHLSLDFCGPLQLGAYHYALIYVSQ
jgi:hypothetical protein